MDWIKKKLAVNEKPNGFKKRDALALIEAASFFEVIFLHLKKDIADSRISYKKIKR
jgi:hypothetical protein